ELAVFIGPFVPNRHPMLIQVTDIGIPTQKPKQFVNDGFDMQFFRREQRESRPGGTQIETGLRAKDGQCSGACAVIAWPTVLENESEQIMILSHAEILSPHKVSPKQKNWKNSLPDLTFELHANYSKDFVGRFCETPIGVERSLTQTPHSSIVDKERLRGKPLDLMY